MQEEIYTLDGKNYALVPIKKLLNEEKDYTKNCIFFPDDKRHRYRNEELLRSDLYRLNIKDYDIGVDLDGFIYPLSSFQEVQKGMYQAFLDDFIITVIPINHEKVVKCGYISFTDTPAEKISNFEEGANINKTVYRALKNCTCMMLRSGIFKDSERDESMTFMRSDTHIAPLKYTEFESTLSLRIMRGFELVKINEIRKSCNEFVFPFNIDLDKYKNIYFCFSCDRHEHDIQTNYYSMKSNKILNQILEYMEENYPELKASINYMNIRYQIIL